MDPSEQTLLVTVGIIGLLGFGAATGVFFYSHWSTWRDIREMDDRIDATNHEINKRIREIDEEELARRMSDLEKLEALRLKYPPPWPNDFPDTRSIEEVRIHATLGGRS